MSTTTIAAVKAMAASIGLVCVAAAPLAHKPTRDAVAAKAGYQPKGSTANKASKVKAGPMVRRTPRPPATPATPIPDCLPSVALPSVTLADPADNFLSPDLFLRQPGQPPNPLGWGGEGGGFIPSIKNPPPNPSTPGTPPAVPEPESWAMLVAGFGMIAVALRRKERAGTI